MTSNIPAPSHDAAKALTAAGAEMVTADLDDPSSVTAAFAGASRVFAMTTMTGDAGVDGEVENGRAIADAAMAAGISDVVYSSVGGAERRTGIPHFESKRRVEEYLDGLAISATLIRPVFFMENLLGSDMKAMFEWFTEHVAYQADREATRALDPEVMDTATWLATTNRNKA